MQKLFNSLFILALLALNWAALHDILHGEPNTWMEWSVVLLSILLLIAYSIRKFRQLT